MGTPGLTSGRAVKSGPEPRAAYARVQDTSLRARRFELQKRRQDTRPTPAESDHNDAILNFFDDN